MARHCMLAGEIVGLGQHAHGFWYVSHMRKSFLLNAHAGVFYGNKGLNVGLRILLLPYFVYARNKRSDETTHMRSLS